jgi:tetratricopeptide (TPR) repeat protein
VAEVHQRVGKWARAAELYRAATSALLAVGAGSTDRARAQAQLAACEATLQRWPAAIAAYEHALKLLPKAAPEQAGLLHELGRTYLAAGEVFLLFFPSFFSF